MHSTSVTQPTHWPSKQYVGLSHPVGEVLFGPSTTSPLAQILHTLVGRSRSSISMVSSQSALQMMPHSLVHTRFWQLPSSFDRSWISPTASHVRLQMLLVVSHENAVRQSFATPPETHCSSMLHSPHSPAALQWPAAHRASNCANTM